MATRECSPRAPFLKSFVARMEVRSCDAIARRLTPDAGRELWGPGLRLSRECLTFHRSV